MGTRRGLVALVVSLGVHLGLIVHVLNDAPAPSRASAARSPVQMNLVWLEPKPPEPRVLPPPKPQPPPGRPPPPQRKPLVGITAPLGPVVEDSPRRAELAPSTAEAGTPEAEEPRGATFHPGDERSEGEQRAAEQERVSARVSTLLTGALGAARVRGGLPDPSYGQLGSELRAATDEVPQFIDTNNAKAVAGALLESWGAGAERYGKTGAPYAEPEGRLENVERPSEVAKGATNGNPDMQAGLGTSPYLLPLPRFSARRPARTSPSRRHRT